MILYWWEKSIQLFFNNLVSENILFIFICTCYKARADTIVTLIKIFKIKNYHPTIF